MAKKQLYVFNIGVLDVDANEIDEICIAATSEKQMWGIFDREYKGDYEDYDTAVIYDCNPA